MRRILLLVLLMGCFRENTVVDPLSITVTASAPSVPADGFSTVEITAQIDPTTRAADRSITFTTTAGTFVGAAAPGTTLVVTADIDGVARATLRSSTTIETANVTVRAGTTVT